MSHGQASKHSKYQPKRAGSALTVVCESGADPSIVYLAADRLSSKEEFLRSLVAFDSQHVPHFKTRALRNFVTCGYGPRTRHGLSVRGLGKLLLLYQSKY
jgi:hypothetical protein